MNIKGFDDTIRWYDNNSDQYAAGLYSALPDQEMDSFVAHLPPGARVLEAGCGPGRETGMFKARAINTVGIDMSEGLLKVARKMNPDVEFVHGNFLNIPFPESTFDGVWAHASLVHLETVSDVKKALQEFNRVLKDHGILFVKVKVRVGKEETAVVTDSLSNHDRFFRYYSPEEMEGYIKESGFKILSSLLREDAHGRKEVQWIEFISTKE